MKRGNDICPNWDMARAGSEYVMLSPGYSRHKKLKAIVVPTYLPHKLVIITNLYPLWYLQRPLGEVVGGVHISLLRCLVTGGGLVIQIAVQYGSKAVGLGALHGEVDVVGWCTGTGPDDFTNLGTSYYLHKQNF